MQLQEFSLHSRAVAGLAFFPYSEGAVLFRPGSRRIWTLNNLAAVIWCLVADNRDLADIRTKLVSRYAISPEQAQNDIESVLLSLTAENRPDERISDGCVGWETESLLPGDSGEYERADLPRDAKLYVFRTPGQLLEFRTTDQAVAEEYANAMKAFGVDSLGCVSDATISVLPSGVSASELFDIYLNNRCYAKGVQPGDVVPLLLGVSFSRITASLTGKLLFHSAVLEKNHRAFLFPAASGSGKTTLAATLARKGYNFFADELALLDPGNGMIAPLPLPMSVKSGAIQVLRPLYPELDCLRSHTRADGKKVKILPPPLSEGFDLGQQVEPLVIIFPRHSSADAVRITPLSKSAAISRLVSLCSSSRPLTARDIGAMVRLVDDTPCYEAVYSDVDTVCDFLERGCYRERSVGADNI